MKCFCGQSVDIDEDRILILEYKFSKSLEYTYFYGYECPKCFDIFRINVDWENNIADNIESYVKRLNCGHYNHIKNTKRYQIRWMCIKLHSRDFWISCDQCPHAQQLDYPPWYYPPVAKKYLENLPIAKMC